MWRTQLWSHQKYPTCSLPSTPLFHFLWFQTRNFSEVFFYGGNGELEFLIVMSNSFHLFPTAVAPASWLSQQLALQDCVWQAWAQLCGRKSGIHVLTGFLCFMQMGQEACYSLRNFKWFPCLSCKLKYMWHIEALTAIFQPALDAVVDYEV